MRALTRWGLGAALFLTTAAAASAAPITYVHTGFGSGTLDGNGFGAAAPVAFTINATSDTTTIQSCGVDCFFNNNLTASITIGGLGTFDFLTPTRFFFNDNAGDVVGFSRAGGVGGDLFDGPSVPGGGWDMTTSIGPVVGIGTLLQWTNSPVNTTGGVLVFNNGNSTSSFTATVGAPEPATLLLLGVGAVCGGLRRRSRRG